MSWLNSKLSKSFSVTLFFSTFSFGLIGLIDDYKKINSSKSDGLSALSRILTQILFGFVIVVL